MAGDHTCEGSEADVLRGAETYISLDGIAQHAELVDHLKILFGTQSVECDDDGVMVYLANAANENQLRDVVRHYFGSFNREADSRLMAAE